jgi:hypothetical protein
MMATTIMISTRVKPDLFDVLTFMFVTCFLFCLRRERSDRRVNMITVSVHLFTCRDRPF